MPMAEGVLTRPDWSTWKADTSVEMSSTADVLSCSASLS
jgi:hypothetical protein